MSNFPHLISKVYREPWLLTAATHHAIASLLETRMAGQPSAMFDDEGEEEKPREYNLGAIGVIPIHGILGKHLSWMETACGGCSMEAVSEMLEEMADDPRVEGILLDINSPGGTVTGTPELAELVARVDASKPVVAFTDSDCCSAAYWIAAQASAIYATGSAMLGSIGVRSLVLDETEAMKNEGIKVESFTGGKYKLLGASFRSLTDDERAIIQGEVDRIYTDFKSAVTSKRNISAEHMEAQVYRGTEAAAHGLIDFVVEDIREAAQLTAELVAERKISKAQHGILYQRES